MEKAIGFGVEHGGCDRPVFSQRSLMRFFNQTDRIIKDYIAQQYV